MMLQNILVAIVMTSLLPAPGVLSQQCYNQPNCTGGVVSGATTAEECCIGTDDGMSFQDSGGMCTPSQCIVHGFENARYNVTEEDEDDGEGLGQNRVDTLFKLNVKGATNFQRLQLIGSIFSEAGPNTTTSDFRALHLSEITVTVTDDATVQLFSENDDITLEYNDTVILKFMAIPGISDIIQHLKDDGEFIRDTAIVDINDNDQLNINFREADYVVNEGDQQGLIAFQFREVQNSFNVTLIPVSMTDAIDNYNLSAFITPVSEQAQAEPGADFSTDSITITIPAGTEECFEITHTFFNEDVINEVDQSFALVAVLGDDVPDRFACFKTDEADTWCFGRTGATTIKIEDNDDMIIGFRTNSTITNEITGTISLTVHSKITSETDYVINFRHIPNIHLTNPEDAIVETSIDDPNVPIFNTEFDARFGARANPNNEHDPLITDRILPKGLLMPYFPPSTSIVADFHPEQDECYTINILITDSGGGNDNFMCYENEDNPDDFFCDHTVCILNDDAPFEVGYVQTIYTVYEDEGPVEVCVNLTKPVLGPFEDIGDEMIFMDTIDFLSLIYIPANATQAKPDPYNFRTGSYDMIPFSDYEQQTRSNNRIGDTDIHATRTLICYDQPIYDDIRLEMAEYFGMTLRVQSRTTVLTEIRPMYDQVAIMILDDDEAVVGLEKTLYNVSEEVGVVEVCAIVYTPNITCPINFPFDVNLSTSDNTAKEPMDYIGLSMTLIFDQCQTRKCVNITIVDDLVDDAVEEFDVTLERTLGLDSRIRLQPVHARIIIHSPGSLEPIVVVYEFSVYTTSESIGSVELCAVVTSHSDGTPRDFVISAVTANGSAISTMDYTAIIAEDLVFSRGQTRVCHTVQITQDDICEIVPEPFEDFFSNLQYKTGEMPIIINRNLTRLLINDSNEPECADIIVGYEFSLYTTSEGIGQVEICAVLMDPGPTNASREFVLSSTTESGTAMDREDFVGQSANLAFAQGDSRSCHTVDIIQDDVCEQPVPEDFFVNLAYVSGIPNIYIIQNRTRVLIDDSNDPECADIFVGYESSLHTTSEGIGQVEICAILTSPGPLTPPRDFVLSSTTESGTAMDGTDYVRQSAKLAFAQRDSRSCHTVDIPQDDFCEHPVSENFFANLAYVSGIPNINIVRNRTKVLIDDSNEPECADIFVGYEFPLYTTSEGIGQIEICAVLMDLGPPNSHSPRDFVLSSTTESGTATEGVDCVGQRANLQFARGDSRSCHTVDIIQDDVCEYPVPENFFVNLAYVSGIPNINIVQNRTKVLIDDSNEPDCLSIVTFSSSSIMAGHTVSLNCSVTLPHGVTSTPNIEWEGPGVIPTPADPTTNGQVVSSVLTLSSILTSQAGQYTCTATLTGAKAVMSSVNVTVKTTSVQQYTPCRISSGATLSFSPVATSNSGRYTCELHVTASQKHVTAKNSRQTAVDITVQIPQPNVNIILSRNAPLYAGGSLTFTCTVTLDSHVDNGEWVETKWSGPRDTSGERYLIIPASGSGTTYIGSLTIRHLADQDDGTYTCTVTVAGPSNTQQATASDTAEIIVRDALFQLRLSGLLSTCHEFVNADRLKKLNDITDEVLQALTDLCIGCGITNSIIDIPSFLCHPKSDMYVTYRARLEGTSETDSGSLISLLEKWVSGRASISVTGLLMTVDPECPVAISSLSEGECLLIKHTTTSTTPPTTSSSPSSTDSTTSSSPQSSSDNTAAIIGGVVAIIFIIAIVIVVAIIGIITFKLRSHSASKKAEEREMASMDSPAVKGLVITTTPNEAYEQIQQGREEMTPQYEVVSSPTETSSVTRHPLPAIPSPLNIPTESVDEAADEQAVYEPIPGDK